MSVVVMTGSPIIGIGALPGTLWALLPAAFLGVALVASLFRKATRSPASVELRDGLRVTPRVWSTIGVLEGFAALGLVVGFIRPTVGVAAATGSAVLMLGAILAHLRVGLAGRRLLAPTVLLASAVAAGIGFGASL